MKEWKKEFDTQYCIHRGRSFVTFLLVCRTKPGAHIMLSQGISSHFLWCGWWEVNFSLVSLLHLCQLFIELIVLLWLQHLTADSELQCLLLTSPFVEETVISPATNRNNFSLNHKSPSLSTVMLHDDVKLFLVITFLHPLHNVTALFPESTSGQNSHFPPKNYWVFIEYISFFVKQEG